MTEGIRPEALDERQIEDLIAEHLNQHLEILPEQDLANALHNFVDKVSPLALSVMAHLLGLWHRHLVLLQGA